ncbi:SLC26A/SulP transporter family protein [uncultured Aquitalea sp.]|uniref:SLC26A/SulP transporter family protein n=1 Tax=uncultured Aquitalea sp. TaxID=540272 RepID=UPI0025D6C8E3|nr:SLC26A/SulP transporter family protein [uncultured Aquitalea sp.]
MKQNNTGGRAGDVWGGLAAMLVALPSAIAFGVAIFAPFGSQHAADGALAGILGVMVLGFFAAALGGTDRLISAPCAPAAAVLSAFAAQLASGGADAALGVVMLTLVAALAGAAQIALGALGTGKLIRYIPYPVVSGYLSAVGITIILSQLPQVLGTGGHVSLWQALQAPENWRWQSLVVGLCVMLTMLLAPRLIKAVPAAIVALAVGVAVYFLAALPDPSLLSLGGNHFVVGPLPQGGQSLLTAALERFHAVRQVGFAQLAEVVWPALTLAILLSIDTLKTCVVLDALTFSHHRSNRELAAQGVGNMASALCGGIPGAGQMGASMVNLNSGAKTRRSGVFAALFALLVFALFAPLVAWVPIAALGGILLVVGFRMIDLHSLSFIRSKSTRFDFLVIAAVIATALSVSLIAASGVGILLAAVLYLREQMRSVILHRKIEGGNAFSRVVRHDQELEILIREGSKTVIVELQGSLFFGTAYQLFQALEPEIGPRTYVILNMRRVQSLDLTATHVFEQIKDRLEEVGAYLIFSEIPRNLPSGLKMKRYLRKVGLVRDTEKALAFRRIDQALEWVEAQILLTMAQEGGQADDAIALHELEARLGWREGCLTQLAPVMTPLSLPAGTTLFEAGAEACELIFIRRGSVRVALPLGKKNEWHIGTFGKGDFIGEMGFLDGSRRSARTLAQTDCELYVLKRADFDRCAAEQGGPCLFLFEGIATALAMRVRMLNKELRALRE